MEEFSRLLVILNFASGMLIVAYMAHTEKRILGNFTEGRPLTACEKDDSILPPNVREIILGGLCAAAIAIPPYFLVASRLACFVLFFSLLCRQIRKKDTENRYGKELKKMSTACCIGWVAVLLCYLLLS